MSVPEVNSVPESAGCPCAHQRRVPPTSPAFPSPPSLSGPHPQPPSPSRAPPGPPVPPCPHLAAAVTMATAGSGAGTSARAPLRPDASRKSLPESCCPHLCSPLGTPAGERHCQPRVPPPRGSPHGWALPSLPESQNPEGVRLEGSVERLVQSPCSAGPSQSTARDCTQAAVEYPR